MVLSALVCQGYHSKGPLTGWRKQQRWIVRLSTDYILLRADDRGLFHACCLVSGVSLAIFDFPWPIGSTTLISVFMFTVFLLYVCLSPGNFKFGFECVDCAVGTFSGGHEGRCKPWAE